MLQKWITTNARAIVAYSATGNMPHDVQPEDPELPPFEMGMDVTIAHMAWALLRGESSVGPSAIFENDFMESGIYV